MFDAARFNGSLEAEDSTVKFYMMNLTNAKGVRLGDIPVVVRCDDAPSSPVSLNVINGLISHLE